MSSTLTLTREHVTEVFEDCLYRESEDPAQFIMIAGILNPAKFSSERLTQHRQEIADMLASLPAEFQQNRKHSANMRKAITNKYGFSWTDSYSDVAMLIQLGIATGQVKCFKGRHFGPFKRGKLPNVVVI
jgi:ABC-type Fe3+-citrate transport system substrate-binding protein